MERANRTSDTRLDDHSGQHHAALPPAIATTERGAQPTPQPMPPGISPLSTLPGVPPPTPPPPPPPPPTREMGRAAILFSPTRATTRAIAGHKGALSPPPPPPGPPPSDDCNTLAYAMHVLNPQRGQLHRHMARATILSPTRAIAGRIGARSPPPPPTMRGWTHLSPSLICSGEPWHRAVGSSLRLISISFRSAYCNFAQTYYHPGAGRKRVARGA